MKTSIFQTADSYKFGHGFLLRDDCVSQYNYLESRGGLFPSTLMMGMSYILQEYLTSVPTKTEVIRFEIMALLHGVPFDREMWDYIVELGYYPIRIKAIPEGTLVPTKMVLATFESTDSRAKGIVGFLETLFMKVWLPTTVATKTYYTRKMLETFGSPEWAMYAYHNFGNRSATSEEHAMIAGFAHMAAGIYGTDSFGSLAFAEDYYGQPIDTVAGHSVIATEHSITTMNTEDGEEKFVYRTILANPDSNILSFVGDSYDIFRFVRFCTNKDSRIRKLIESRPHQKLVIRPDSGDAIEVLEEILTIMIKNNVATTVVDKKVLFTDFGLLWGDGVTHDAIKEILTAFTTLYSKDRPMMAAENFVFGSGTDLVNNHNRDTQKFAIKCSSITVERNANIYTGHGNYETDLLTEEIDVFKDPITDPGKASKKGKVTTYFDTETREFIAGVLGKVPNMHCVEALVLVFENGKFFNAPTLAEIRERSA